MPLLGSRGEERTYEGVSYSTSPSIENLYVIHRYLHALEARSHAAEAVLGILMSIPDQRAISLLTEIAEDSFARSVLEQVNNGVFGLRGREPEAVQAESSSAPTKKEGSSI
jgi:hypothetical protein